jgi:hypothetical protein
LSQREQKSKSVKSNGDDNLMAMVRAVSGSKGQSEKREPGWKATVGAG